MQTLKSVLKKADDERSDPSIVMLQYRNTPISGLRYAPEQLTTSRLLRSKLQTTGSVLQPRVVNANPDLQHSQQQMKRDYDRGATSLKPLTYGDVVRVQRKWGWDPAIVQYTHESPRSYVAGHERGELRHIHRILRRTHEQRRCFFLSWTIPVYILYRLLPFHVRLCNFTFLMMIYSFFGFEIKP